MTDRLTAPLGDFKEREIEILQLMAEGLSNPEIADRLFVTRETVRWYNKQIYSKLGTSRRTEAIALAQEMGLIGGKAAVAKTETSNPNTAYFELPITNGPFVGRESELVELSGFLSKPKYRLLSIIAAGGMGKSRLSLEVGHLVKSQFKNGAVFIDLTAINNPDDIATATLQRLGLTLADTTVSQEILLNYCREKELLLIFDNFEHVLSGAGLLSKLLETGPKLKIIATTREQLNLRLETAYYLQPIIEDGGRLFTEIALMMHPNLEIGEEERPDIEQIVNAAGGMPLALVLAATWLDTLSIPEIGKEIKANLDFLSTELQDMPDRQRSMHAVIDPTWGRLSEAEQKAFMWASVFRGGFSRESFQQVTGASLRTIQSLLRRSLIYHSVGRRYNLHPLIHQYALEKLQQANMVTAAKQAHLETFLSFAQNETPTLLGKQFLDGVQKFEVEQGNLRAALEWGLEEENEPDKGVALTLAMIRFWLDKSQLVEASEAIKRALHHQPDHAELHMRLGYCYYRLGDAAETNKHLQKAIELAEKTGDLGTLANSYRILVPIYFVEKKSVEDILGLLEKAIEIGEALEDVLFVATCHNSLGMVLNALGHPPDKVLAHYSKALAVYEEQGNQRNVSSILQNMALEHYRLRDMAKARELAEHSLSFMRQINDKVAMARRITTLANWDIVEEEFEQAHTYLTEAQLLSEEMGERNHLQYTLYIKGILLTIMGDFDASAATLKQALELAERLSKIESAAACHSNLGQLCLMQQDVENARPHIFQALRSLQETVFQPWAPMMAYANYLWHTKDLDTCAPIVATMSQELELLEKGEAINNQYFLRPLIYRVQQKFGAEKWNSVVKAVEGQTLKQHFETAIKHLPHS